MGGVALNRLLSVIIGLTVLYQSVSTYDDKEFDKANEWLNKIYDGTYIHHRFGDEIVLQDRKFCTSPTKQNGTCVKKELCLDAEDPATQFIPRERDDTCKTSEACCLQVSVDPPTNKPMDKPIKSSTKDKRTCTTEQREEGICVKKSLCSNAVQTVDWPTQFISRERDSCHALEACCLESNVKPTTIKSTNPTIVDGCGWSNPGANIFRDRSTESGLADYGEFPWMIALIRKENEKKGWNETYTGGGALIHPSVVITTAHKVTAFKPTQIKVRAGEWDTRIEAEVNPYQEIDVNKIIIHEKFVLAHFHNNVALLILKSPVDLTDAPHIGIACLAPQLPPPGTRCFAMGWGTDFLNKDAYAVILKKLQLPLVEASVCEKQYQGTRLGNNYRLNESLTCAGGEKGVDTCVGDGGSPLVCPVPGQSERFAVVGMVAYGLGCGIEHLPGVYVNIPNLYNWVGRQLMSEQLNKTSFDY